MIIVRENNESADTISIHIRVRSGRFLVGASVGLIEIVIATTLAGNLMSQGAQTIRILGHPTSPHHGPTHATSHDRGPHRGRKHSPDVPASLY
jgi:hypothetical protein